uniref:Chromo domain-containing protein n=1 Tax=Strongyloides papillosus TaxID=174720 RepID=A0A0N5B912_STREA
MKTNKKNFDMEVSSEKKETSEGEDTDNKYCEMEYIVDVKVVKDGTCKYLVKWKNYSEDDGTWEPIENFRRNFFSLTATK